MGKDMTFFLFVGMFQGVVNITRAYRKESHAKEAFGEYTGLVWDKVNSDEKIYKKFDCTDFAGSQVSELQIEA